MGRRCHALWAARVPEAQEGEACSHAAAATAAPCDSSGHPALPVARAAPPLEGVLEGELGGVPVGTVGTSTSTGTVAPLGPRLAAASPGEGK